MSPRKTGSGTDPRPPEGAPTRPSRASKDGAAPARGSVARATERPRASKGATKGATKGAAKGAAKGVSERPRRAPASSPATQRPPQPTDAESRAPTPARLGDDAAAPRKRTKLPPERPGQPGGKRARNRDVRIAALMESGLKLFLERGVESVTIDEIAREAGMAKGNFYRYFDDKRALVDRLVLEVAADVRTAMRKCAVSLGRATDATEMGVAYAMLAIEIAQATTTRLDVVRLYLQENRAPATPSTAGVRALADELADGAVKLTVAAVDRGLLRVSDPRVSGLAVVGAIEQLVISVLRGQLDTPPLEVGRIVVSMVLDGIRAH